jgi:L-threonylcarbamoyladenylate synthase
VAIRVPAHPVARALIEAAAIPVAAPSANLFSRPSPTRAEHVLHDLQGRIDMVIDGGATPVGVESTVLDLSAPVPTVLRPGAISLEMLREVMPNVDISGTDLEIGDRNDDEQPRPSPGMMSKHYAPRAPLTLFSGDADAALDALLESARDAASNGRRVGVLVAREDVEAFGGFPVQLVEMGSRSDIAGIATRLYAALRQLDGAGVDVILARDVNDDGGLARAIRDRLRRAASAHVQVG